VLSLKRIFPVIEPLSTGIEKASFISGEATTLVYVLAVLLVLLTEVETSSNALIDGTFSSLISFDLLHPEIKIQPNKIPANLKTMADLILSALTL
jgi:hypothetical protein